MSDPIRAADAPFGIEVEAGESYFWCACGRSVNQPFCDGSHLGTNCKPLIFTVEADEQALLCMCKRSKTPPFCDGSHSVGGEPA